MRLALTRHKTCLFGRLTAILLFVAWPVSAQIGGMPGQITGLVQFKGGVAALDSVIIYLESEMGEVIQQSPLLGNGRFRFEGLDRTAYVVRAKAPGFRDATYRVDLRLIPTVSAILTLYAERPQTPAAAAPGAAGEATVPAQAILVPEAAQQEFNRGEDALKDNAPAQARAHFQKAIEIFPQYYQAYLSLGTLCMDEKKWDEAEQAMKRSLEINDHFAAGYAALGAVYNRQGKPAAARPVLERSLELEPNGWQAHFELAQALLLEKKDAEAEPHLWRAHELEPKMSLVHFLLGKISLGKRDLAMARTEFQHFLDLDPSSPLAGPVRQKLAQIDQTPPAKP